MAGGDDSFEGIRLWVDLPTAGAATAGALVVSGWAFHTRGARITRVEARVGARSAPLGQGLRRPDVALQFGDPHADWCGFEGTLAVEESDVDRLDRLTVRATDEHGGFAEAEVPVRIVPSGRPVVEIERLLWRGNRLECEGWRIWPDAVAPTNLVLELDGLAVARTRPNLSRPDVARRFPAFAAESCRGFRLSVLLDSATSPRGESTAARLVFVDGAGSRLVHDQRLAREAADDPVLGAALRAVERAVDGARERLAREPMLLDWCSGLPLSSLASGVAQFAPPAGDEPTLPYLDDSVDLVATDGSPLRAAEARRVAAIATIEGGELRWKAGAGSTGAAPSTSIAIVIERPIAGLASRLAAIERALPADAAVELIVIDDSGAGAAFEPGERAASHAHSVRLLRHAEPLGFARSANRAAELARGELFVLLAPDTLPQPGWLAPLHRLLAGRGVGAVGGKLLSPAGRLLEAGRILRPGGSPALFGHGDAAPFRPIHDFVREVDELSIAFLALRRATLLALGGFDPRSDREERGGSDLCARLRASGLRLLYQPASVATSVEAAEPEPPARRPAPVRVAERPGLFARRRSSSERRVPERAELHELAAASGTRRALVCAPRMPEFDRECGSQRTLHLVESLQREGWQVSYLAWKSVDGERYARLLRERGVVTYAGPDSLGAGDEYLDDLDPLIADGGFELAIVAFWSVAEALLPRLRALSPATRVIVDTIDLHYLREERAAERLAARPEPAASAAGRLERKRRELAVYAAADAILTVSTKESEMVARATAGSVPVFRVPLIEELAPARTGFPERRGLLFVGNFHHPPNLEGLEFFRAEVAPRLGRELLAAHPLTVVGNGANGRVREVVAAIPHARLVGWVPSLVPYLERALISVVPLLHGAGTKGKLIQALMIGTPSVSTAIGVEGLELESGRHVLVADDPDAFAAAIRRLSGDAVLWSRLAREGRRQVESAHGRAALEASFAAAVEGATRTRRQARPA